MIPTTLRRTLLPLLLAASTPVLAEPYAITYTGTVSESEFAQINDGEPYRLTLVFDNGGASAVNQTWTGAHLTCALWRMNTAGDVAIAHDLAIAPPSMADGAITTDGAGALASVFSRLAARANSSTPGAANATGISLGSFVRWYANDANYVLYIRWDTDADASFGDAGGGVAMAPGAWSAPRPFSGPCAATAVPPPAPPSATPVPALSVPGLALLGLAAGGLGARRLRRNAANRPARRLPAGLK